MVHSTLFIEVKRPKGKSNNNPNQNQNINPNTQTHNNRNSQKSIDFTSSNINNQNSLLLNSDYLEESKLNQIFNTSNNGIIVI